MPIASVKILNLRFLWARLLINACLLFSSAAYAQTSELPQQTLAELSSQLKVGDIVFIRVPAYPFKQISLVTQSWTNHVGIIVQAGAEPLVAESAVPLSKRTPFASFVARSTQGRVAVLRLNHEWSEDELAQLQLASDKRMGVRYDTGFDLYSRGQFCSRFVREVVQEASGITLGEEVSFDTLFKRNPEANLRYWKVWYFGSIPWSRHTVTPASLYQEEHMAPVFDGYAFPA